MDQYPDTCSFTDKNSQSKSKPTKTLDANCISVFIEIQGRKKPHVIQVKPTMTVTDLKTRVSQIPLAGAHPKISFQGKMLQSDSQTLSCLGVSTHNTLKVQSLPLPGGMNFSGLNNSQLQSKVFHDGSTTQGLFDLAEDLVQPAQEQFRPLSEILEDCFKQLDQAYQESTAPQEQTVADIESLLSETQSFFCKLTPARQNLVKLIFATTLDYNEEVRAKFEDEEYMLLDVVNASRSLTLQHKLRVYTLIKCYYDQTVDDAMKLELEQILKKLKMPIKESHEIDHLLNPRAPTGPKLSSDEENWTFIMSQDKRNLIDALKSSLPENAEKDVKALVRLFDPQTTFDLIIAMTPQVFRDNFLTQSSSSSDLCLLQLIESAQHNEFITFVRSILPGKSTEKEILEGLSQKMLGISNEFQSSIQEAGRSQIIHEATKTDTEGQEAQAEMQMADMFQNMFVVPDKKLEKFDQTNSDQVKAIWLKSLKTASIAKMVSSMQNPGDKLQMLNLCSLKQKEKVLEELSEEERKELIAESLLELTGGNNRKTFEQLEEEADEDNTFVSTGKRIFRQCMPRPNNPRQLIIYETEGELRHLMPEQTLKGQLESQIDAINKNEKPQLVLQDQPRAVYSLQNQNLYENDDLNLRLEELELNKKQQNKLRKSLCEGQNQFLNVMTAKPIPNQRHGNHGVSIWELTDDDEEMLVRKDFIQTDEPFAFKDNFYALNVLLKAQYLYSGRNGEVFWFCRNQVDENSKLGVDLYLLEADATEPSVHRISDDSKLYKHIVEGNSGLDNKYLPAFPTPLIQMIRDTPETPVIVFSFFQYGSHPSVEFYDLNVGREIAAAANSHIFLGLVDVEGQMRLLVQRDPLLMNQIVSNKDEMIALNTKATDLNAAEFKNGYPTWYHCPLDLAAARESDSPVSLIQADEEDPSLSWLSNFENKTPEEVAQSCAELENWVFVQHKKTDNLVPWFNQGRKLDIRQVDNGALLTLCMRKTFGLSTPKTHLRIIQVQSLTDVQEIQHIDEKSQAVSQTINYNKEDKKCEILSILTTKMTTSNLDGSASQHYEWNGTPVPGTSFSIAPVVDIGDNQFVRVHIGYDGKKLIIWKGRYSGNQSKLEKLQTTRQEIRMDKMEYIVDYPIMCHRQGYNELVMTHLADKTLDQLVLKIEGIEFICFLHQNGAINSSSIAFLGTETKSQRPVVVVMMHDSSFKKETKADGLESWTFQSIILDNSFKQVITRRKEIQKAFLMEIGSNSLLLNKQQQPTILIQTKSSVFLAQKDAVENITEGNQDTEMVPIEMLQNRDLEFFYVIKDVSTSATFLVETRISRQSEAWIYTKRIVYQNTTGSIIAIESNPEVDFQHPQLRKYNGLYAPHRVYNRLYVLDSQLNLIKLKEKSSVDYEIISKESLTHLTGLQKIIERIQPWQSFSLASNYLLDANTVYHTETGHCSRCIPSTIKQYQCGSGNRIEYAEKYAIDFFKSTHDHACRKQYMCIQNDPSRRNIGVLGLKTNRNVRLFSLVSDELILFLIETDRLNEPYWALMDVKCQIQELPASLKRILCSKNWSEMFSSRTVSNQYLLTLKHKDCLTIIQFSSKGAFLQSYEFPLDVKAVTNKILIDQFGNVVHVVVQNEATSEDQDRQVSLTKSTSEEGLDMTVVTLLKDKISTIFFLCGDYLVLQEKDSTCLKVFDLNQMCKQSEEEGNSSWDYQSVCKQLDLTKDLVPANTKQLNPIGIDVSSSLKAIHGQQSTLDEQVLKKTLNMLQVTYMDRACIYDLSCEHLSAIEEIPVISNIFDEQRYVENGSNLLSIGTIQNGVAGVQKRYIKAIQAKSYYLHAIEYNYFGQESKQKPTDYQYSIFLGLCRTFTRLDLEEIKRLRALAEKQKAPKKIDSNTIYAQFDGQSIFTLEEGNLKLYMAILEHLQQKDYELEKDSAEVETENRHLRLLAMILLQKSSFEIKGNSVEMASVIVRAFEKSSERDLLLKIGRLCQTFSVFDIINNETELKRLLKFSSGVTTEELGSCFKETYSTRKISMIKWPRDLPNFVFRKSSCVIDEKQLDDLLGEEDDDRVLKPVMVRQFDIRWMFSKGTSFLELSDTLCGQSNSFYSTEFIEFLLEEFWERDQKTIFWHAMVPYLFYMVLSIMYMYYSLKPDTVDSSHDLDITLLLGGILSVLLWAREFYLELIQFWEEEEKMTYLKSFWNLVDWTDMILTILVLVDSVSHTQIIDIHAIRIFAAIACLAKMVKLFDWLRLFEDTAFYILLVSETMSDIKAFMILLVIAMLMFGLPMMMLSLNTDPDKELVESTFSLWPVNVLYNQYMLSLGEFNIDNFQDSPNTALCFIFFIMATFITQITMLNMLIAIMGDTFERVIENREVNSIKTKLDLMSDLAGVLKSKNKSEDEKDVFLYVVTPDDEDLDNSDDWEGVVNKISRDTDKHMSGLKISLNKQIEKLIESQETSEKRDAAMDKDMKKQISVLNRSTISKFTERMDEMDAKVANIEAKMTKGFENVIAHLTKEE